MSPALSNGYSVYRQVFAPLDLSGLREAIRETIDRTAHALRTPFEESAPDAPFDERLERVAARDSAYAAALFHAVMADVHRDARVQALASHEALRELVARTLQPLRVTGQVIRPRAIVPSLSHAVSPWHQDVLKPSTTPGSCGSVRLACWIPLADVDEETGALEVIPGRWIAPLPHVTNAAGQFHIPEDHLPLETLVSPKLEGALPRANEGVGGRRAVPMSAGDVLVLDRFVPHRSLPLRSGHVRWAIVMWFKALASEGEA
jgi:ectoine hydroxylase-related dioxygenase (phytanoyl-CoA dioxygenase family)